MCSLSSLPPSHANQDLIRCDRFLFFNDVFHVFADLCVCVRVCVVMIPNALTIRGPNQGLILLGSFYFHLEKKTRLSSVSSNFMVLSVMSPSATLLDAESLPVLP